MKEIKVSELLANIIQRMIVDEINNQTEWLNQDLKRYGVNCPSIQKRKELIKQLEEDRKNLQSQGYPLFEYYW